MKNAQRVAKVEERREDARALRKLSRNGEKRVRVSHVDALGVRRVFAPLFDFNYPVGRFSLAPSSSTFM